jgi:hypothetical protein
MKITRSQLKKLIKEEMQRSLLTENVEGALTVPGTTPTTGAWTEEDEARSVKLSEFANRVEEVAKDQNPSEGSPGHQNLNDWAINFSGDAIAGGLLRLGWGRYHGASTLPLEVAKSAATQVADSMNYDISFTDQTQTSSSEGGEASISGYLFIHLT